jgi:hypothetical protein
MIAPNPSHRRESCHSGTPKPSREPKAARGHVNANSLTSQPDVTASWTGRVVLAAPTQITIT